MIGVSFTPVEEITLDLPIPDAVCNIRMTAPTSRLANGRLETPNFHPYPVFPMDAMPYTIG